MDPKAETLLAYQTYAPRFDDEYRQHMLRYNLRHTEAFLTAVSSAGGKRILDIGCGPGMYAAFFEARGFDVLCGDLVPAMVRSCRESGLRAQVMDLETLELAERFDGIWANACLLHVSKARVEDVLDRLAAHLAPGGVFACAVKEGEGERLETEPDYPDVRRFFSYYQDEAFRAVLRQRFQISAFERTSSSSGRTTFLKYLCRLRAS